MNAVYHQLGKFKVFFKSFLILTTVLLLFAVSSPSKSAGEVQHDGNEDQETGVVEIKGKTSLRGLAMDFVMTTSVDGKFRIEISGPERRVMVFDGENLWRMENGGYPYRVDMFEKELFQLFVWSVTDFWQAQEAPLSRSHGACQGCVNITIKGGKLGASMTLGSNGKAAELDVSYSPASLALVRFSEWTQIGVRDLPKMVSFKNLGPEYQTYYFENAIVLKDPAPDLFKKPVQSNKDFSFLEHGPSPLEVRRVKTGHLLVRPLVNGQDVGWFLFDTGGATTSLKKEIGDGLGLEVAGKAITGGFGGVAGYRNIRKADTFQLGNLQIKNINLVDGGSVLSMLGEIAGVEVVGIVGWDILSRAVVQIDMEEAKITLFDAEAVQIPAAFLEELYLHWKVPYVAARFEGDREGMFMLDTGGGGDTVLFHSYAVEKLKLLEGRETTDATMQGAGGSVAIKMGRLDWFEINGYRTENPVVEFSYGYDGEYDIYSYGFISGGVVKPFSLIFDFRNNKVGFLPRNFH